MNTLILCSETDDPNFISEANRALSEKIAEFKPIELFVTYINNWFDLKWLKFSGTIMHEIAIWEWQDVTVPPFNPNRVIYSKKFTKFKDAYHIITGKSEMLHITQESSANRKRKITDFSSDGLFIWYSSNTKLNDQGSILVYYAKGKECLTFYFNLVKRPDSSWITKTLIEK
jgi:hypothetical protein